MIGLGMFVTKSCSVPRVAAVWAAVTGAAVALAAAVLPQLATAYDDLAGLAAQPFDRLLVWTCDVVALAAAAWLWSVTTAVTVEALRGRRTAVPGIPDPVRRLVLRACGVAVAGGLTAGLQVAAQATPGELHQDHAPRAGSVVVAGLPLPDRAVAALPGGAHLSTGPVVAPSGPPPSPAFVTVRPDDTLWDIARRELGPAADATEIAARWREIYELNRTAIGADPDVIQPAQRLRLPTGDARPDRR
jgi:nucleoid-associated protein YgaU